MSLDWIDRQMDEAEKEGLLRSLRTVNSQQGPVIVLDGKEVLNFSSNDYLGLASDRRLIKAAQIATAKWGAGAGSSRLIAGNLDIFSKLESQLALMKGAEACLLFTSGYHANLGLITSLVGKGDAVFSDRLNHASIIDGAKLSGAEIIVYDHHDAGHLDRLLAEAKGADKKLVVTESLFSMDGDLAPLPDLLETAKKHQAMFMIDDAHATGILGAKGAGGLEHFKIPPSEVDALMGTLGKSLGSSGAFVCGSKKLIDYLANRARTFVYTTGPSPGAAGAALEALRIMKDEAWRQEQVQKHASHLRAALAKMNLDTGNSCAQIVPVLLGSADDAMRATKKLLDKGIYAQGIRPPTVPEGASRLRINLSAGHTLEQVDNLIEALVEIFNGR